MCIEFHCNRAPCRRAIGGRCQFWKNAQGRPSKLSNHRTISRKTRNKTYTQALQKIRHQKDSTMNKNRPLYLLLIAAAVLIVALQPTTKHLTIQVAGWAITTK